MRRKLYVVPQKNYKKNAAFTAFFVPLICASKIYKKNQCIKNFTWCPKNL